MPPEHPDVGAMYGAADADTERGREVDFDSCTVCVAEHPTCALLVL